MEKATEAHAEHSGEEKPCSLICPGGFYLQHSQPFCAALEGRVARAGEKVHSLLLALLSWHKIAQLPQAPEAAEQLPHS